MDYVNRLTSAKIKNYLFRCLIFFYYSLIEHILKIIDLTINLKVFGKESSLCVCPFKKKKRLNRKKFNVNLPTAVFLGSVPIGLAEIFLSQNTTCRLRASLMNCPSTAAPILRVSCINHPPISDQPRMFLVFQQFSGDRGALSMNYPPLLLPLDLKAMEHVSVINRKVIFF